MEVAAVITAAGSSRRMVLGDSSPVKKEYLLLPGDKADDEGRPLTVLGSAVSAFASVPRIKLIVITVPANSSVVGEVAARASLPALLLKPGALPRILFVPGGLTRRSSVHHGLALLSAYNPGCVLIHDGARPWADRELIERVIDAVEKHRAAVPLIPLTETPKEIDGEGFVCRHLRRSSIGAAQTPQGFAFPDILNAHAQAVERELREGYEYTDDAEVWGEFIGPVSSVPGAAKNRKITFLEDIFP
jgi:2-C-methyl-D-erythritol 4-phosphate cytidylyltransferase/2-C-methyl-D-erythritol 4-phosphate cytidylyltransferase/2-C-methyl-D-erythritol 2,4-cyclodiphosphate synthase